MPHSDKSNELDVLEKLKAIDTISELAELLRFKRSALNYILHGRYLSGKGNYISFEIDKKNGEKRKINAPIDELKTLQKTLSKLLHNCFMQIQTVNGLIDHNKNLITISHGFQKGKSIITNAEKHRNKKYVLNLDLENFFGTIHYGRIYGFFTTNKYFKLSPLIARTLANIVCYKGVLPQGAPTSPVISNLIAHIMDIKIVNLAKEYGFFYTRYADDLTFSTNKINLSEEIVSIDEHHRVIVGNKLIKIITKSGFFINNIKTRIQYNDSRQDVTGLIVNKKVNVKKEYANQARVLVNNLFEGKSIYKIGSDASKPTNINYLLGVMSYIYHVRKSQSLRTDDKLNKASNNYKSPSKENIDSNLDAQARLYRDLIFFNKFVANKKPLIICEGKTDIVYLRTALTALKTKHPFLIDKEGNLKIDFLNQTKTISDFFKINGGTGDLKNLIYNYSGYYKRFSSHISTAPIIILLDNDDGSKTIKSTIKEKIKKEFKDDEDFKHIVKNLYVMQTPLLAGGKPSAIEDLFDSHTRARKLANKTFAYKGNVDNKKNYGKDYFAIYIVKRFKDEINFNNFDKLFETMEIIERDYFLNKASYNSIAI